MNRAVAEASRDLTGRGLLRLMNLNGRRARFHGKENVKRMTPVTPVADMAAGPHLYLTGFPLLLALLLMAAVLPFILLGLAQVVMFKAPSRLKQTTYESGMTPFGDARVRFDVKFYLYALLFILFDIETAFLFPWAMALGALGPASLVTMLIFIGILLLGLVYAWKKDALRWQ